jgi:hypothetical protein
VSQALDEMLSDAESLTRTLLGAESGYVQEPDDGYAGPIGPRPGLARGGWSAAPLG